MCMHMCLRGEEGRCLFSQDSLRAHSQERKVPDYNEFRLGRTAGFSQLKRAILYGCYIPEFLLYE